MGNLNCKNKQITEQQETRNNNTGLPSYNEILNYDKLFSERYYQLFNRREFSKYEVDLLLYASDLSEEIELKVMNLLYFNILNKQYCYYLMKRIQKNKFK